MFTDKNPPKSICILRLSAIGDVTHVIPAINAIKRQWPMVKITWICGSLEYKLLSFLPDIRFIVFDKKAGISAYLDVKRQLKNEKFDVLLHMQVAARANLLSMFIKANLRLGWDKPNSKDLHQLFINYSIQSAPHRHQVQAFLEFARTLGISVNEPEWNLSIPAEATAFAHRHISDSKKVLLISPCSSHPMRNWSAERYAQVADFAINKLGMQVILCGGPSELENNMGAAIEENMVEKLLNLVGKDTLIQLLAILKEVDVVITPDSGPAHMANAVNTTVLGLYACSNPERVGPYNSLNYCANQFPLAVEKFAKTTVEKMKWGKKIEKHGVMDLITVEEVKTKLKQIILSK